MPGKDGKDVIPTWSASEPPSDQMPGHVEPTPIPPPGSNYLAWIIVFVVVFVAGIAFVLLRNGDDGSDPQVAAPTTVFQDDSAPGGGISDDAPQDGGGASDPDDAVDPDAPPDAGGPTLTPSPVEGGVSPDLLGQFTLIGDGVIEFAYEGDRIIGRVVQPARSTGIDLWGQLSLCTGGGSQTRTEASFIGEITYDLDAFGNGKWFFFDRVPDQGFSRCVRLDDGEDVMVAFGSSQADAIGTGPDGGPLGFSHVRVDDFELPGGSAFAVSQEPDLPTDVRNELGENHCIATDRDGASPDVNALQMANIAEVSFRRDDASVIAPYAPGGVMEIELGDGAAPGLPGGWSLEFGLAVEFGQFVERGEGVVGLAEWSFFFDMPILRDGKPVTAIARGPGETIAEGTATATWVNDGISIEFPALSAFPDANSFSISLLTTVRAADGTATSCSDLALVDAIR